MNNNTPQFKQQDKHIQQYQSIQLNYYQNLKKYVPICYSGNGIPFLLKNKFNSLQQLTCLIIIDIIFVMLIVLLSINPANSNDKQYIEVIRNVNILVLVLINLTYLLTAFMNPGIIAQEDMSIDQGNRLKFCSRCNRKITEDMQHCIECQVCVDGLDHHCGFFGKCIAGAQKFAFYGFILCIFIGFICLLASISTFIGEN